MTTIFVAGSPEINVRVTRSARARRLSLRVSSLDGRVTLTAPNFISARKIEAFVQEKASWLRENIGQVPDQVQVQIGTSIPMLGQHVRIEETAERRVWRENGRLFIPQHKSKPAARVLGYLKSLARDVLTEKSDFYAGKLGVSYDKISLRDTRSRWGSCSPDAALMFSWRLIMAPLDIVAYVAAHEVAHLQHMDHSKQFWDAVEHIYGNFRPARLWLRENGAELHRYRFVD